MKTTVILLILIAWAYFFTDNFIHFWGEFFVRTVDITVRIFEYYKTKSA